MTYLVLYKYSYILLLYVLDIDYVLILNLLESDSSKGQCMLFSVNQGAKLSVECCYIDVRAFILVKFEKMQPKKHEEKGKDSDQM